MSILSSADYDSIASTYDRRYEDNDYSGVEDALVAFMGPTLDVRVLEVGCGTGHCDKSDNEITIKINQWAADTYPVAQKHLDTARTLESATKKRSGN